MKRLKKGRSSRFLIALGLFAIGLVALVPLTVLFAQMPDSITVEPANPTTAADQTHDSEVQSPGKCPFLYTRNHKGWNFQSDMYPPGLLGPFSIEGRKTPFPLDYTIVRNGDIEAINGILSIKVAQELDEVSYLDSLELLAIDHSQDIEIVSDIAGTAGFYNYWNAGKPTQGKLYTIEKKNLKAPNSCHYKSPLTSKTVNCLSLIAEQDGLGTPAHSLEVDVVELDLGDLSNAPQIKFVMNGVSVWPTPQDFIKHPGTPIHLPLLSIKDGKEWRDVPDIKNFPTPRDFKVSAALSKKYVFNATGLFPNTGEYKIRIHFHVKSSLDYFKIDTSEESPLTITVLKNTRADFERLELKNVSWDGNYTGFGEVTELISKNDDKFVIFGQGEGIYADYTDIDKIDGKARTYVVRSIGYYKQHKFGLERTIKPLPFSKMSAYPYDETIEHYPDDQEHNAYQAKWNTRVKVERK